MAGRKRNVVATILKVYAILNALCGFVIFLSMQDSYYGAVGDFMSNISILFLSACIVVSFIIYAFGEVVQLLQDIKDGTRGTIATIQNNNNTDDLPSI